MMPYYVGIDGGGTKTAVELRTRGSAAHSRAVFGPLNCNSDRTAAAKTLTDTLARCKSLATRTRRWPVPWASRWALC